MLFDDKKRTRLEPKKVGESDYAFYDSAARPEFQTYRDLVNGWIMEMPEAERAEMVARFRKNDNLGYQAALAELTIHAALVRQGYKVEVHPDCGHPTRRPDFLARTQKGEAVAYVEVTTFGPAQEHVALTNREAKIYNAIDAVTMPPGHRLGYDVMKYGKASPSLNKLCKEVEEWAKASATDDPENMPAKTFVADDWEIELTLIGGFKKDVEVTRAISSAMGDVRIVKADIKIREALSKKGSRYGELKAPYVIVVVDCKDELTGGHRNADALLDAVYGSVVTEVTMPAMGEPIIADKRLDDGYWGRPEGPKHRNVSAAILLPKPHLWDLRNDRWLPLMLRNHWAEHPVPEDLLALPGYRLNDKDSFEPTKGTQLADILELPKIWPPEEKP